MGCTCNAPVDITKKRLVKILFRVGGKMSGGGGGGGGGISPAHLPPPPPPPLYRSLGPETVALVTSPGSTAARNSGNFVSLKPRCAGPITDYII